MEKMLLAVEEQIVGAAVDACRANSAWLVLVVPACDLDAGQSCEEALAYSPFEPDGAYFRIQVVRRHSALSQVDVDGLEAYLASQPLAAAASALAT